jgi:hypothetical protein
MRPIRAARQLRGTQTESGGTASRSFCVGHDTNHVECEKQLLQLDKHVSCPHGMARQRSTG